MTDTQILAAVAADCEEAIRVCQTSANPADRGVESQAGDTLDLIAKLRKAATPAHVATLEKQ